MPVAEVTTSRARLAAIAQHGAIGPGPSALLEVHGPGALTCVQGLLTNDLEAAGDGALVYGALLTAKGAIVADLWVLRVRPERLVLALEAQGADPTRAILARTLPPRLAKVADRSAEWASALHLGGGAPGMIAEGWVAHAPAHAPFTAMLLGPRAVIDALAASDGGRGPRRATTDDLEAARILAGWPRLGREIDERTLVQEVRFDDIGGVSYTKGCYVGQETVARLHFRGHANRRLAGLAWPAGAAPDDDAISHEGRPVGSLRSLLALEETRLGLAMLRREVDDGAQVMAGGQPAVVCALPFSQR